MWQSRQWRYLLSRIDHLPRNSAYVEAVSLDDELAAQVAKQPKPDKPAPAMRMRDFSPELEALATVVDRLGDVVQAVIAAQGGKPPQIPAFPRPKTATDRLNDPRRHHQKLMTRVAIQQEDGSVKTLAELAEEDAVRRLQRLSAPLS